MKSKAFKLPFSNDYEFRCRITRDNPDFPDISDIQCGIWEKGGNICGLLTGQIIHLVDHFSSDEVEFSLALQCDCHSQGLGETYGFLLMDGRPLEEFSYSLEGDLIYLERLNILPKHRGKGLGLSCCAAVLVLLQKTCHRAAMKPYPLQWEGKQGDTKKEFRAARKKLISYYRPLGFSRIPEAEEFHYRELKPDEEILGICRCDWKRSNLRECPHIDWDEYVRQLG